MRNSETFKDIQHALKRRFPDFAVENQDLELDLASLEMLLGLASRQTHRKFQAVDPGIGLVRLLCTCALSAPSKGGLQQSDILIVRNVEKRRAIAGLIPSQPWISTAPVFLIFLANGKRVSEFSKSHHTAFQDDLLDAFFNPIVDTGVLLANFMRAADAVGLGTCPISAICIHAHPVSQLFELPEKVIPVAGLCVGWPEDEGTIQSRLPLAVSLHEDKFEGKLEDKFKDNARSRKSDRSKHFAGWTAEKAQRVASSQATDFGSFVRSKGFDFR